VPAALQTERAAGVQFGSSLETTWEVPMEAMQRSLFDQLPEPTITQPPLAGQSSLPDKPVVKTFKVAGLQHRCKVGDVRKFCEGSAVELIREPRNSHDPNAVQVRHYGKHIGYVPSDVAREIAPLMDAGFKPHPQPFIDLLKPGQVVAAWTVRVIVKLVPPAAAEGRTK